MPKLTPNEKHAKDVFRARAIVARLAEFHGGINDLEFESVFHLAVKGYTDDQIYAGFTVTPVVSEH